MACAGMSGVTTGLGEQKEKGPIDVLFLCDEWKSTKGGLTTFNRELAINFAKATTGSMKIHCYVSKSDDQDRENARRHSVNLITAKRLPGIDDPLDWLKIPPSELPHPDIVIGHGRKFGAPAFFIVQATKCKWLQFVHVFCEDIGKYKAATTDGTDVIEENEKKHKREIELCKAAHVVVAVGRRLQRKYSRSLLDVEVEIITPGTFENFASETRLVSDKSVFKVLLVGRANFEDLTLKGYDIIADAIGILGKAFELTFVGASSGEYKKIQEWFLNKSRIDLNQLTIRGYSSAQDDIKSNLHQSDLVTLPSRTDGFGLVALEAISAGIPILVASECGIAEALREVEKGKSAIVEPDRHVEQWVERIRQLASQSPEERQTNATLLRENYQKKYPWQTECNRFKGMIQQALETTNVLDVTVDVDNMETRKGDMQNTGTASSKVELSEYHRGPQPGANVMPTGGAKPPGTEDGRLINDTSTEKVLHEIALRYLKVAPPDSRKEFGDFLTFLERMRITLTGVGPGSLVISVKCVTLQILDRLWDHYLSGYLGKMVQDCFVTEDILQELNLVKLKLKTTMKEEEYKICRVYLEKHSFRGAGGSLKSDSLGFTSRDPIKQEVGDVKTGMEHSYLIMKEESGQQKDTHERKFRGGMVTDTTATELISPGKKSEEEEIRMEIDKQIERDKKDQERKQHEKLKMAGKQSLPSFDVNVAMAATGSKRETSEKQVKLKEVIGSGARPKETKRNERSKKAKVKEAYVNEGVNENCRTSCKMNFVEDDTSSAAKKKSYLHVERDQETSGQRFANKSSAGIGLQSTMTLPKNVFSICNHFLQDNRKRGNYKHPIPCPKCSKDSSKLLFGVWRSSKKEWQVMRPCPKRLNFKTPLRLCWHFSNGRNCLKNSCTFAHGREELEFWTLERESENGTFRKIRTDSRPRQEVEPEVFPKPQELIKGSLVIRYATEKKLKPSQKCANPGKGEGKSWMERKSEETAITRKDEPNRDKGKEFERNDSILRVKMPYSLPGVTIKCDKPTMVTIIQRQDDESTYTFDWVFTLTFEIAEVGMLHKVHLLHRYHECYRLTEVKGFIGDKVEFCETPTQRWFHTLHSFFDEIKGQVQVAVTVSFNTTKFHGTFTQCLQFDFERKPHLLQGLNVDIAKERALSGISEIRQLLKLDSSVWTEGSVDIIRYPESTKRDDQEILLEEKYGLPKRIENILPLQITERNLSFENYRRVMHQLLFTEELFIKKAISRFAFHDVTLHCKRVVANQRSGLTYAVDGELFGVMELQRKRSSHFDDAARRLLTRAVQYAWLRPTSSSSKNVHEAKIETIEIESQHVTLKLSSQTCLDLQLTDNGKILVDAQFQLNRQPLCQWHDAIDKLGPVHLKLLFPENSTPRVNQEEFRLSNWQRLDPKLNESQREVIKRILAPEDVSSPLVVFGPFGTGKTFTLNQAIRELVTREGNRVLLCTHTNSAADIHVKLLHKYLTEQNGLKATKPLRIYQTKRRLNADLEIAKRYGLVRNGAYVLPTREDVILHRVVITTLAVSRHLLELRLNHGFFTHILIDEAYQALEPEALIPLALAGPNTKVVFTGDHMQMSPEVYSSHARDWGLQRSLPERLFDHLYNAKHPLSCNVMILTENYRCHQKILQFSSHNFYKEGLIARSEEPPHPRLKPLLFYSVSGMEEARENSYINAAEVDEIVKRVKELAGDWPEEWKEKDLSRIGVVSAYLSQVQSIRQALRSESEGLKKVTVETIYNVQGKEFRALFISTVRTSLTFPQFHRRNDERFYWEFFSDQKLLNTAVTRAMSLVAVVGDAVSLCTVGECRSNWRDFIRRCDQEGSLLGTSYAALERAIATPLSKVSLNPEAAVFVPRSDGGLKPLVCDSPPREEDTQIIGLEEESSDEHSRESPMTLSGSRTDLPKKHLTVKEVSSKEEEMQKKDGYSGQYLQDDSFPHQEAEDDAEHSNLTPFEDFRREGCEDETVLPSSYDKVIEALVAKKKETQERELQQSVRKEEYPSLRNAESINRKGSKKNVSDEAKRENSNCSVLSSDDYQFFTDAKGRVKARLVNFEYHQSHSGRRSRPTGPVKQDEYLDPEVLLKLMREKPEAYCATTLQLDSEAFNMAYATVPDTETPDIRIRGRIRRVFDMDHVVVNLAESRCDEVPRHQGKIVGVLHHIISPHERQFVCKVNYENPDLMIPINKSMSKIAILSADGVKGVPLYKEIREGKEKKVKVYEIDHEEFLSEKYLFLVQFLQWRSDCTHPLGIIIRKLPKKYTRNASMEILLAEHGIRKSFRDDCERQVRTKFPSSWSIPAHERKSREVIKGAFTIDPENSKDLDDALSLQRLSSSVYRVGIHIADVSYFVEAGSHLDKEALFRCISYYPGQEYPSVPMLPPELSEKHCSLLPGKDRLCLSVFLDMSEDGKCLGEPQIKRTIVTSSSQLTYSDAQKVIDAKQSSYRQYPHSVESDIQALSALAQRRRKLRLRDSSFDHWSHSDEPEYYEAHELVEEMMILANETIGQLLLTNIPEMAPLRTQLPPKDYKLKDWLTRYGHFIKCSLFLRGNQHLEKMTYNDQMKEVREFKVQDFIWSKICSAVESDDKAKLQQLIFEERNYPQLAVANCQFQRIQQKSCYVCERSDPQENSFHFSLEEQGYTHFTSPIRRYIDIQVHRLVLDLISNCHGVEGYRKEYVAKVCRRSTFAQRNSRKFDRASSKVNLAAKLKEASCETKAVIAMIEEKRIRLEITSREFDHLSKREREIKFSDVSPYDFILHDSEIVFIWKLRLYIVPKESESLEDYIERPEIERNKVASLLTEGLTGTRDFVSLEVKKWIKLLKAVQDNDYAEAKMLITETDADHKRALTKRFLPRDSEKSASNVEHFHERQLSLATFDIVNVQLSAHMTRGMLHPQIQLFKINSKVHICIEHRKYPRECFSTTVRYQASRRSYSSLESYITAWEPVLAMESATEAVEEGDEFTIHDLDVKWRAGDSEIPVGSFSLDYRYCKTRQIEFHAGDFVCIRVPEDFHKSCPSSTSKRNASEQMDTYLEEQLYNPVAVESLYLKNNSSEETYEAPLNVWVGHCVIRRAEFSKENTLLVEMDFHQSASKFPEKLFNGGHLSTVNIIHRSLPNRRMFSALKELRGASKLAHAICLGKEPGKGQFEPRPLLDVSIMRDHPKCGFKPLNLYQTTAVKRALEKPFTVIQGPPGTGKTVTGVHIAFGFAKRNKQNLHTFDPGSLDEVKAPPQVIYCGPSNKAVDVVAEYMIKVPGLKIIRIYSDRKEQAEFPIPNKRQPLKQSSDDGTGVPEKLKNVSLHHIIRKYPCPYADDLESYEKMFEDNRKKDQKTSDKDADAYCELIGKAEVWALQSSGAQIILCTCSVAGSRRMVTACDNIQQCIIDECGMCLELESLVPITFSRAKQVVLIGDHKQLQPVVQDQQAVTLGLNVSMFERLCDRAQMLEIQYRMHKEICRFPSDYFYEEKLKTDKSVPANDPILRPSFWPDPNVPLAFCHVEGEEESTAIKTTHSSEQSKSNQKEVRKVVHVARCLVFKNGVSPSDVVILSPYREQRERISKALEGNIISKDIPVTTITKSQGSEWDYVILSLARSLNKDELEPNPSLHWLREHLGFLTDEHQINVGLTRARKGLCIIGNRNLLVLHPMWQKLVESYERRKCMVDESTWPRS